LFELHCDVRHVVLVWLLLLLKIIFLILCDGIIGTVAFINVVEKL
jgi:hypothetical protein